MHRRNKNPIASVFALFVFSLSGFKLITINLFVILGLAIGQLLIFLEKISNILLLFIKFTK